MPGGDLTDYIKKHSGADRVGLVGTLLVVSDPTLTPPPAIRYRSRPSLPPLP